MSSHPEKVGRYEIRGEIGRGAMGRVYRGFDPQLGREVAIKMIATSLAGGRDDGEEIAARFLREARVAARLQHPGVVAIYDAGREGDSLYLVMELIDGETLAERLSRGEFPPIEEALELVAQAADALAAAHATQIVHRDIKPGNLMITRGGRVKVADFGVAKAVGESTELTRTGMMVGSPAYMAPEQVKGQSLDGRSDLFSLGVVLYEMLLRRKPFPADTVTSLVYQILHEDPMADAAIASTLRPGVSEFLRQALAKDREERIPDAETFATGARELAAEPASATAPTKLLARRTTTSARAAASGPGKGAAPVPERPKEGPSRRGLWAALAVAVAVVALVLVWSLRTPPPPEIGAPAATATAETGQPLAQPEVPEATAAPEATATPAPAKPTASAPKVAAAVAPPPPTPTATPTPEPTPPPPIAETFSTRSGAKFDVSPEEARVTVEGRYLGIADDWDGMGGGKIYVFPSPGEYVIHLELEGYRDAWIKVIVTPDAKRNVVSVDTELEEIDE